MTVAVATQESVPVELHAIGTVEASAVIQVKSQVAGELSLQINHRLPGALVDDHLLLLARLGLG